jgi:hypothetical protein
VEVLRMQTIRGVYDGRAVRLLPTETLPAVEGEVEVEIRLPEAAAATGEIRERRVEAARRLLTARAATPALGVPVWELVDDGRDR